MIYIEVFAVAVAIILILRIASFYFRVINEKHKIRKIFLKFFPMAELILWGFYAIWTFDQLLNKMGAYPILAGSLIILISVILGWYFLRDYISGALLKSQNSLEAGQQIQSSEVSGTIKKLGYLSMEIITSEGELVKIPYSLLAGKKIVRPAGTGNWTEQIIKLKVSSSYPFESIQNRLKNRILEMPWIVADNSLKFKISRDETGNYLAEIHLHLYSPEMALKTENELISYVRSEIDV